MKKFLLLIFFAILGFSSIAQDVILKKDGSEINAKVLELTDQYVKYKDFDFQSGPTRNINISDVFMITYENGKKEVFKEQVSVPASMPTPTSPERPYNMPASDLKNEFDRIGTNDLGMLDFFRRNNFHEYHGRFESAYHQGVTGRILRNTGIVFSIFGIADFVTATILYDDPKDYKDKKRYMTVGYIFTGVGLSLIIVSIPVSTGAKAKREAIKNDFARKHFGTEGYTYQPKLNFGSTPNGVGLTLNF
jgi:hypothetical protein